MANITNKTTAVSFLTTSITNPADPNLQPAPSNPIKSGNLQQYLRKFLDWVFPPNNTSIDMRGKVLGISNSSLTTNLDYTGLEFLTMMPLGGICMYAMEGENCDLGGGKVRAKIGTHANLSTSPGIAAAKELDGFLYCVGGTIDTNVSGNEIFKNLKDLMNGRFGNTGGDILHLPNMQTRVPIGYSTTSQTSPADISNDNISMINPVGLNLGYQTNYGKTGNIGGKDTVVLRGTQLASHYHLQGSESLYNFYGGGGDVGARTYQSGPPNQHSFYQQYTSTVGSDVQHENRMQYMVVSYIIKY